MHDKDLLGDEILPSRLQQQPKGGYPATPGTGPDGKTCGDCDHYRSINGGTRRYPKCYVINHRWTHGSGTDIKKSAPACRFFNYGADKNEQINSSQ